MPHVQLPDRVLQVAQAQAVRGGFASVAEYIADVVLDDASELQEAFDAARYFTPERIAELDAAAASVRAGHGLTGEQLDAELAKRRAAWLGRDGA